MQYVRKAIEGELPEGAYPYLVIRIGETFHDDGSLDKTVEENKAHYLSEGWEETDEQDWLDHSSEEVREAQAMADDVNSTEEAAE